MSGELVTSKTPLALGWQHRWPPILRGWRLPLAVGLVAVAAGLAWQWSWLVAIGVAPVLLSVGPCAAMCGLGLCMAGMGGRSCQMKSNGGGSSTIVTQTVAPQAEPPERINSN
jgi:hypothetical protein